MKLHMKPAAQLKITIKDDQTPVTNVDQLIHDELIQSLDTYFPDVPVISEEGISQVLQTDKAWPYIGHLTHWMEPLTLLKRPINL